MSNVTTTRFELKQLFHLMIPILVTQFAQAGFGLIDTIMAGHMSSNDLAAIAVGVGLWIPIMLLFSGIMIATTPLVAEANGCEQTMEGYLNYIREHFQKDIQEMEEYFPVICGEWCLFNSLACGCDTKGGQSVLNGVEGSRQESFSPEKKKEIYEKDKRHI